MQISKLKNSFNALIVYVTFFLPTLDYSLDLTVGLVKIEAVYYECNIPKAKKSRKWKLFATCSFIVTNQNKTRNQYFYFTIK